MLHDKAGNSETAAAREARFRLQAPNAAARDILVIPLDPAAGLVLGQVAAQDWTNARFVGFSASGEDWRAALERSPADLVVLLGQAGENLSQVISIGEICLARNIKISGVLLRLQDVPLSQMAASLRNLRPWTQTLAVIAEAEDLSGLLHALGA